MPILIKMLRAISLMSFLRVSRLVRSGEAATVEGAGGDSGGQAEEDPSHERTSRLQ